MLQERDPNRIAWLDARLTSPSPRVRRRAVELLQYVVVPMRSEWIRRAARDVDPAVRATAALVEASITVQDEHAWVDLAESDFSTGELGEDLRWEWEYRVQVCWGNDIPRLVVSVWTRSEDDELARTIAIMKSGTGAVRPSEAVAFITSRSLVTSFTRRPRNAHEAMRWDVEGRPRYIEGDVSG